MISELTGLEQAVAFTFVLTMFGTAAAAVLFFSERDQVAATFRTPVVLAALVCAIAAGSYFFMRGIYVAEAVVGGASTFPTEFRYIDWLLTVPLMLAAFPMLLGLGRRGARFMSLLIGLAVVMVLAGYVGEVNPDDPVLYYGMWALGSLAWVGIAVPLLGALRDVPARVSGVTVTTVRTMGLFVLVGWLIYPVGYLQPALGLAPEIRELVYNLADLVNKVGLGVVIFLGGRAAARTPAPQRATTAPTSSSPPPSVADALLSRPR